MCVVLPFVRSVYHFEPMNLPHTDRPHLQRYCREKPTIRDFRVFLFLFIQFFFIEAEAVNILICLGIFAPYNRFFSSKS